MIVGSTIHCKAQQQSLQQSSSSKNGIPNWAVDPTTAFSERQYLMAIGSGDNLADARSDAMLNLAQIFRSQIEGTQNLYTEFAETTRNRTDFTSRETIRLMNNIRVGANEELMNTEILKSEVGTDGAYYVLAGMDRAASLRVYEQEIANNYQKIDNNRTNSENAVSAIQKLSLLKENVLLAKVNENLNQQLAIIAPGNGDSESAINMLDQVQMEYSNVQENSIVNLKSGLDYQVLNDALASVFQKEGFILGNSSPVLEVEVLFDAEPANLNRDDAEFVMWDLSIKIIDVETGKEYNTFSTRGRDGALSLNDAYKRAEFSASKEIESAFSRFFINEVLSN
jgi:hypothetical protein